jgi:glycosyltransferase involved in cell wall biosynthesis
MDGRHPAISIIVPAYNEAVLLGATLDALNAARGTLDDGSEIIVVDDASTDATARIAAERGARVVPVDLRHIAAARNAGAREARGELLVFVDADTIVPPAALRAAVAAYNGGAVGGGARVTADAAARPWARRALHGASWVLNIPRWAAGCFVFARRDAFERVAGFDERFYASEEIHLSRALKRLGRFVIVQDRVITSARKAEMYSFKHTLWLLAKMLVNPWSLRRRDRLPFWYERRN